MNGTVPAGTPEQLERRMDPWQRIVDELDNNSFVIFADEKGARIVAKLRGATADEIGLMLGAAQASLERQVGMIRDHVRRQAGEGGTDLFDAAMDVGRMLPPAHEGMKIYDRKPQQEDE